MSPTDDATARTRRLLVAGGGTAGHVFPGLAVARELLAGGWSVSFVGRAGSLEERLVADRGIPFLALPALPFVGRGGVARLAAGAALLVSALRGRRLVRRSGAVALLGTGGFVSAPAVLGARLAGCPVVLLEPNARAGSANRWLSRWVAEAAVAYPETTADLACPAVVTGVPVRGEFFAVEPPSPRSGGLRLLVLGGSQGAREINELVPAALAEVRDAGVRLTVVHQAGEEHLAAAREHYAAAGLADPAFEIVPFLTDVAAAMAASDLVVSRAGAITLAEICAAGRAALLAPLRLAGAHQVANARSLEAAGAAIVLDDGTAAAHGLARRLVELAGRPQQIASMGSAARRLAHPEAARRIAERIVRLAEEAA